MLWCQRAQLYGSLTNTISIIELYAFTALFSIFLETNKHQNLTRLSGLFPGKSTHKHQNISNLRSYNRWIVSPLQVHQSILGACEFIRQFSLATSYAYINSLMTSPSQLRSQSLIIYMRNSHLIYYSRLLYSFMQCKCRCKLPEILSNLFIVNNKIWLLCAELSVIEVYCVIIW